MTDLHTHTTFSHDGICRMEEMIAAATERGIKHLGFSEHVDYDVRLSDKSAKMIDLDAYFQAARAFKAENADKISLYIGLELGFINDRGLAREYADLTKKYKPDYIINSVHLSGDFDYYRDEYSPDKSQMYSRYLTDIYDSIHCGYDYDIVGHIGYAARYAPYADKRMDYASFKPLYDKIIDGIIEKDKILELNSACRQLAYTICLPSLDVAEAYYKAGGRKVCFGSDAHNTTRLAQNRQEVLNELKKIGFKYLTLPHKGEHIKIDI